MNKKLIGGALVAGSLLLLPTGAQAGNPHGGGSSAPAECLSLLYPTASAPTVCKGYTYTCVSVFYPHQLAVFTDSDATEDQLETSLGGHWWHCTGTPDNN